jgi:hypothetical protein
MSMTACRECGKTIDCSRDVYVVCVKCGKVFCKKHVEWNGFVCKECDSPHSDISELVVEQSESVK